jgi:putative hydrolase of the HAD superfamily
MKAVVFDLDDTLYDELTYVRSGFGAVASYLAARYEADASFFMNIMWNTMLDNGRGKVFDTALESIQQRTRTNVNNCITIYRLHQPQHLELYTDAEVVLRFLEDKQIPRYVVTDGNKLVQHRKLQALQLEQRMNKCFITHRYGVKHSKPSPYCFNKIAEIEKVDPSEVVYIGDNVSKDFVGIKPLGFQTARIMRGSYASLERPYEYQADVNLQYLTEIIDYYHL